MISIGVTLPFSFLLQRLKFIFSKIQKILIFKTPAKSEKKVYFGLNLFGFHPNSAHAEHRFTLGSKRVARMNDLFPPRGDIPWLRFPCSSLLSTPHAAAGSSNLLSRDVMCSSSSALLHIPEKQRIKAKTEQGKEAPAELQWRPQFQPLSAISEAFLLNPRRPNSSICFPNPLLSTHPKKISSKSAAEAALEMVPKLQRCHFFLEVY